MHPPSHTPHYELMTLLHSSLRSFQQRRDQRRSRYADPYTPPPPSAPAPPHASAPTPKRPTPAANFDAASASLFGAGRFIDVDGRAVAVMDPEFLQKLQDQMQGMTFVPPSMRFASSSPPPASPTAPPAANDTPASTAETSTPPPGPADPVPAKQAGTNDSPEMQASASTIPSARPAAATNSGAEQNLSASSTLLDPDSPAIRASDAAEHVDGTMRDHHDLVGALLREHETRLKEQAEAAAAQQAALLRDVLTSHRTQQEEQAARHTQVIRDLLREHQNQLDEHATAAVTREAQIVGTLLREHREALAEAREQHRSDLDEMMEQHRDEMRAMVKARSTDAGSTEMKQLRDLLAEHAKIQHSAHEHAREDLGTLAGMIEQIGEGTARLTFQLAQQQESWLPPPSFAPPPNIPAAPLMLDAHVGLAGVAPPPVAAHTAPRPTVDGLQAPLGVVSPPSAPLCESPAETVATCAKKPSGPPATKRHEGKALERARIEDLLDAERADADDDENDDDWPDASPRTRLAPLTPLEIPEEYGHG